MGVRGEVLANVVVRGRKKALSAPELTSVSPELPGGAVQFDGEQLLAVAKQRLDRFLSLEPQVLRDEDVEAIHDFRVASRRLQQIFDLLFPRPRPPKIRKLRRSIRRARRALSVVRNCDVLMQRAGRTLGRKRLSHREPWEVFHSYLEGRRAKSFQKAARRLGRMKLSAFYVQMRSQLKVLPQLHSLAHSPSEIGEPAGATSASLSGRLATALQEAWLALEERTAEWREERSAPALHAVRIAAKQFRYLIEVIHELGDTSARSALEPLRRFQDRLGDWNDLEVMEQMMLEMIGSPEYLQEHLPLAIEIEQLVVRNRRTKKRGESRILSALEDSPEWSALGEWVNQFLSVSSDAA
jgi:CHAD domain-containing protein